METGETALQSTGMACAEGRIILYSIRNLLDTTNAVPARRLTSHICSPTTPAYSLGCVCRSSSTILEQSRRTDCHRNHFTSIPSGLAAAPAIVAQCPRAAHRTALGQICRPCDNPFGAPGYWFIQDRHLLQGSGSVQDVESGPWFRAAGVGF